MTYNVYSGTLNPTHFTSRESVGSVLSSGSVREHVEPVAGVGRSWHGSRLHRAHTEDTRADGSVDETARHGHWYVISRTCRSTSTEHSSAVQWRRHDLVMGGGHKIK